MAELEELIQRHRPKLIFTNPTFHNPTGRVLSLRERRELLDLAARYRVPLLEDDPYRETHLDAEPPPSLHDLDTHNIVIYLSTFSKTLAPGLRLGWLAAPEYIVDQLALIKQREALFTEGAGQYALAAFLQSGQYDDHLVALRREHALRRDAFHDALKRHAPARLLKYALPSGGLYFWCRVERSVNPSQWSQQALGAGVSFTSGEVFYADGVQSNEARFCYTRSTPKEIRIGVQRLMTALKSEHHVPSTANSGIPLV